MEYMQQIWEQIGLFEGATLQVRKLPRLESRDPVHNMYAIFPGAFPSPGRNTLLNGRVGAISRSICIESMTFDSRAEL
jgi:hypothetical protein